MKEFLEQRHKPTLAALLAYKDTMRIADKDWHHTVTLFELGPYATLAHLRKLREEVNNYMPATSTPDGHKSELPLLDFIKWLIQQKRPTATTNIIIKFAFDGANMTSKRGRMQEIGTFELITDDLSLAEVQSPNNCHQYIIYIGGESKEEFERELESVVPTIEYLMKNKVEVNGQEFDLEPVLVCDLKALVTMLGLYCCYHPKSHWKCPWCLVSAITIHDFDIVQWPLRDEKEMMELAEKAAKIPTEGGKDTFARENYGITGKPVLPFGLDHIIPCMLHCLMGITKKLFELLVEETYENENMAAKYLLILEEINIKLIPEKSSGKTKKKRTLHERVEKSCFGHPQHQAIIEHHQRFLMVLQEGAQTPQQQKKVADVIKVWTSYHKLISLAVYDKVNITQEEWLTEAREFGHAFTARYDKSEVTPYIHIFMYHLGFYLEKFGSVQRFANFGIESKHSVNKKTIQQSSSHFKQTKNNNVCKQQLNYDWRITHHQSQNLVPIHVPKFTRTPVTPKKALWSTRNLAIHPDMEKYIVKQ